MFGKTVDKMNDMVEIIEMNKKIQDLDREFSTEKLPIIDKNRRLLIEEQLTWIHQGKILVNAYFFNDMILFINEEGTPKKIIYKLTWSKINSYVISLEDGKTMTNVINISCPDGNATLECGKGSKGADKKEALIAKINVKMLDKQGERVIVQALGTE